MKHAPVIIIRKKKGHGHGHHGGAWKVAYADFVTAMMAFFLVLWIVGQSAAVKAGVGRYFRDPGVLEYERSNGILPGGSEGLNPDAPPKLRDAEQPPLGDLAALTSKAEQLKQMLSRTPEFKDLQDQVQIQMTDDGLRIELMETSHHLFFDSGSAALKPETVHLLGAIARELSSLPNRVTLEGHTDSRRYANSTGSYTNWELSADRANGARRIMEGGLRAGQVSEVRGYADTRLRHANDPMDARNRRVSIIVMNQRGARPMAAASGAAPAPAAATGTGEGHDAGGAGGGH